MVLLKYYSGIIVAFGPHCSLITVVSDVSYEIALRLDCLESDSGKFYKSRDVVLQNVERFYFYDLVIQKSGIE